MNRNVREILRTGCALAFLAGSLACATSQPVAPGEHVAQSRVYWRSTANDRLDRFAPLFVIDRADLAHNRIGTPRGRLTESGQEEIYVDPDRATVFVQEIPFETARGSYTNLVYRVHFSGSPFRWSPFNPGAGRNVGLMTVITLDEHDRPVLVNTVHTCGCYHAIVPTEHLDSALYPEGWALDGVDVYGERLPGLLRVGSAPHSRVAVWVRDDVHRVRDLTVEDTERVALQNAPAPLASRPMEALRELPLGDGDPTSFYYEEGRRRGLVKGAFKPWETLLFGLWIRDFHVGHDREYTSADDGALFYTTLDPRKKTVSDMWDYAQFLELNGWRL